MNPYEMTFIVRPDLDEEQTRAAVDQVKGRIQSAGGEIIATYPWNPARRRMAYPIRDFGDGFYVTTTFRFPTEALKEFERTLRLNTGILRFLIVQATDMNIQQSQQRMQQANAPRPVPAPEPVAAAAEPEQAAPAVAAPVRAEPSVAPEAPAPTPEPAEPAPEPEPVASAAVPTTEPEE